MDYVKMAQDWAEYEKELEYDAIPTPQINVEYISYDDMKNGTGLRTVVWVTGCSHHCKNCHNPQTWDPNHGVPFTIELEEDVYASLKNDWVEGITFSGGDPLFCQNRDYIGSMVKTIKDKFPSKNIWVYTGYQLKEIKNFLLCDKAGNEIQVPWLKYIDVLVDGPFEQQIRNIDVKNGADPMYRGSSNQRLIDIPKSIRQGAVVNKEV